AGTHSTIAPATDTANVSNGAAFFTVKNSTIETVVYTATDVTDGITLPETVTVQFVAPPATSADLIINFTTRPADGTTASTITVALHDEHGQGAVGKVVSLQQGQGHSTITGPTPAVTGSDGKVTFTVTNNIPETVTYSAIDVTDGDLP